MGKPKALRSIVNQYKPVTQVKAGDTVYDRDGAGREVTQARQGQITSKQIGVVPVVVITTADGRESVHKPKDLIRVKPQA